MEGATERSPPMPDGAGPAIARGPCRGRRSQGFMIVLKSLFTKIIFAGRFASVAGKLVWRRCLQETTPTL